MKAVSLPFDLVGVASRIGEVISIAAWAERMRIPDRAGGVLGGARVADILGVHGKSWSPELFADPSTVTGVAKAALRSAHLDASDVDALVVVTCTPYEVQLGQDGFRFARELDLRDDAFVVEMHAGCGGLARVMRLVADLAARRVMVLAYNAVSPIGERSDGPNPLYLSNATHPFARILWASPGIFSDGVAAAVLERADDARGFCFYSRDQRAFGDGPGFRDPIVHYPGGGVLRPPGYAGNEDLMAYAMSGKVIAEYYNQGMMLNYARLLEERPSLIDDVARVYSHQAGPAMVRSFMDMSGLGPDKVPTHAAELGNLVSPCTLRLLDDDLRSGEVGDGDEVCFSVVGAGPERGAFVLRARVREVVDA